MATVALSEGNAIFDECEIGLAAVLAPHHPSCGPSTEEPRTFRFLTMRGVEVQPTGSMQLPPVLEEACVSIADQAVEHNLLGDVGDIVTTVKTHEMYAMRKASFEEEAAAGGHRGMFFSLVLTLFAEIEKVPSLTFDHCLKHSRGRLCELAIYHLLRKHPRDRLRQVVSGDCRVLVDGIRFVRCGRETMDVSAKGATLGGANLELYECKVDISWLLEPETVRFVTDLRRELQVRRDARDRLLVAGVTFTSSPVAERHYSHSGTRPSFPVFCYEQWSDLVSA